MWRGALIEICARRRIFPRATFSIGYVSLSRWQSLQCVRNGLNEPAKLETNARALPIFIYRRICVCIMFAPTRNCIITFSIRVCPRDVPHRAEHLNNTAARPPAVCRKSDYAATPTRDKTRRQTTDKRGAEISEMHDNQIYTNAPARWSLSCVNQGSAHEPERHLKCSVKLIYTPEK